MFLSSKMTNSIAWRASPGWWQFRASHAEGEQPFSLDLCDAFSVGRSRARQPGDLARLYCWSPLATRIKFSIGKVKALLLSGQGVKTCHFSTHKPYLFWCMASPLSSVIRSCGNRSRVRSEAAACVWLTIFLWFRNAPDDS